jgi:hypothetical protein
MHVPKEATNINYYTLEGSFQVYYKTKANWPGDKFINSIVNYMSRIGWKRLEEDFLNPGRKLHWAREGDIYIKWGFYEDKGIDVHLWMDDWEDSSKNIVRYSLKYRTKRNNNVSITCEDSNLEVIVIYIPAEIRPDPATPRK